jgi:hypothetical protein
MQYFIKALVTYLACDGATTERMPGRNEALHRARFEGTAEESLPSKMDRREFSQGRAVPAAAPLTGYWRFRDWMARHPERVRRLREAARVTRGETGL